MRLPICHRTGTLRLGAWILATLFLLTAFLAPQAQAQGQSDDAKKILKVMSDFLTAQKNVSATFDTDIEVITTQLQKIQFTSSGQLTMIRPDKFRATRQGGYSDVEMVFDGSTTTIFGKHNNIYAQTSLSGSVDKLIDWLRDEMHVAVPGADLLMTRVFDQLMEDVVDAKYIGHGVVDGVECDHLAFRNPETDWQIWIERGPRPLPRKYVITSKATAGAPQYTLRIKTWSDAPLNGEVFAFKAPTGAKRVDVKDLQNVDEVPPGVATGGGK